MTMARATLGNHLKSLRAQAGFTQADLAERVGVSRKTINTVENGVFTPSATLALQLARALGVPVEALFFLQD
jgi:putative transcriptional regulator